MVRRFAWYTMTLLALGVAAYAGAALVATSLRPPFVQNLFANLPAAISAHLAGGIVAIVIGAFQVNSRLRSRFISIHRWSGRVYIFAVLVGGVAGFVLALHSFGGLVTHFGFGLMAIFWVATTLNAYRHIRRGDLVAHRAWMLRSYALTLAAVTLRIYVPLSQVVAIEFEAAYQVISWLCWVPNLLVIEWYVLGRNP
jgi:uncharacterized membrane protein